MTAHEIFTALLWIVLLAYLIFLGWFVMSSVGGWRMREPRTRSPLHPAVRAQQSIDDLFEWDTADQKKEDADRAA